MDYLLFVYKNIIRFINENRASGTLHSNPSLNICIRIKIRLICSQKSFFVKSDFTPHFLISLYFCVIFRKLTKASTNSRINPFNVLPPIGSPQNALYQNPNQNYPQPTINHIIAEPPQMPQVQPPELYGSQMGSQYGPQGGNNDMANDNYLPIDPIYLNSQEEQNLMSDVSRELGNYSSEQLKMLYNELTSYDPTLTGYTHYTYVNLVGMRNNVSLEGIASKSTWLFNFVLTFKATYKRIAHEICHVTIRFVESAERQRQL